MGYLDRVVGMNARRIRQSQKRTIPEVAEVMTRGAGGDSPNARSNQQWTKSRLQSLETGRRHINVDDLSVLIGALSMEKQITLFDLFAADDTDPLLDKLYERLFGFPAEDATEIQEIAGRLAGRRKAVAAALSLTARLWAEHGDLDWVQAAGEIHRRHRLEESVRLRLYDTANLYEQQTSDQEEQR